MKFSAIHNIIGIVYPNPTRGKVFLFSQTTQDIKQLSICDLAGKKVYKKSFSSSKEKIVIVDVSHLLSGIYILNFSTEKNNFSKKLVKE